MPLFVPYSFRSKAIVPAIVPEPVPALETGRVSVSCLVTPRIVKSPSTENESGPVCSIIVDLNVIIGFRWTSKKSFPFNFPFLHAATNIDIIYLKRLN
jgi:hypothetical protein